MTLHPIAIVNGQNKLRLLPGRDRAALDACGGRAGKPADHRAGDARHPNGRTADGGGVISLDDVVDDLPASFPERREEDQAALELGGRIERRADRRPG